MDYSQAYEAIRLMEPDASGIDVFMGPRQCVVRFARKNGSRWRMLFESIGGGLRPVGLPIPE